MINFINDVHYTFRMLRCGGSLCLSPGLAHCVVFLGRRFTLRVPLSSFVYINDIGNIYARGNPVMD